MRLQDFARAKGRAAAQRQVESRAADSRHAGKRWSPHTSLSCTRGFRCARQLPGPALASSLIAKSICSFSLPVAHDHEGVDLDRSAASKVRPQGRASSPHANRDAVCMCANGV